MRTAELEIREGTPSHQILEACEEHHPGLVVMGTRGLTGLGHFLLGSTTERVVRSAKAPVWTVH